MEMCNAASMKSDFTFGELARMALGDTVFNNRHMNILHLLFACLLRKLNCADEIVTIDKMPFDCLKEVLPKCGEPLLGYRFANAKSLRSRCELLERLEHQTDRIKERLEQHFEEVDKCNRIPDYPHLDWDRYCQPDEDIPSAISSNNVSWYFLHHNYFLFRMRSIITRPIIRHIDELEESINASIDQLNGLKRRATKLDNQLRALPLLIRDNQLLKQKINENFSVFERIVVEIQEMLNCKLDRLQVPALKQYIRVISRHIVQQLHVLQKDQPPMEKAIALNAEMCLSCSKSKAVTKHQLQQQQRSRYDDFSKMYRNLLSPLNQKILANYRKDKTRKRHCRCKRTHTELTLMEKMNQYQIKTFPLVRPSQIDIPANCARHFFNRHRFYLNERGSLKSIHSNMFSLVMESRRFKNIVSIRIDKPLLYRRRTINPRNSAVSVYSTKSVW